MKDNEILEKCHKGECICDGCERRFVCWTTKRVFSDPTQQALYEAYVAEGLPHKEAIQEVKEILERAIMQAAIREQMEKHQWDLERDVYKKHRDWQDEYYDKSIPKIIKWDSNTPEWKQVGLDEAQKGMKDLQKYFQDIIKGKK